MSRVAVVGAGPVGLALCARLLGDTALQVCLFDAKDPAAASADPRTIAINAGSQALLSTLRAWPAQAVEIARIVVSQHSTPFASVELTAREEGVPALGYTLRYGALVSSLFSAMPMSEQLEPRFGQAVRGAHSDGSVVLEDGSAERFDAVLICEGGLFAEQPPQPIRRDYAQTALIGSVRAEKPQTGTAFERFTHEGALALLPQDDAQFAMVWCLQSALAEERAAWTLEQLSEAISARFGAGMGRLSLLAAPKAIALGLNAHEALVDGVCVRLGNAAQTLHPVAGQGFNLGLRDAWQLADALTQASSSGGSERYAQALEKYARARRVDRQAMIRGTDFLARAFTWQLPLADAARGAALGVLTALPPARRALAQLMMYGVR